MRNPKLVVHAYYPEISTRPADPETRLKLLWGFLEVRVSAKGIGSRGCEVGRCELLDRGCSLFLRELNCRGVKLCAFEWGGGFNLVLGLGEV